MIIELKQDKADLQRDKADLQRDKAELKQDKYNLIKERDEFKALYLKLQQNIQNQNQMPQPFNAGVRLDNVLMVAPSKKIEKGQDLMIQHLRNKIKIFKPRQRI